LYQDKKEQDLLIKMNLVSSKEFCNGQMLWPFLFRTFCLDTKSTQKVKAEKCSLAHPTHARFSANPRAGVSLLRRWPSYEVPLLICDKSQ